MSDNQIYVAMALTEGPGGYSESPRKAFESEQDCKDFLEHEPLGGRVVPLVVEGESDE